MEFSQFLKKNIVIFDGGMGTMLQKLLPEETCKPEENNTKNPEVIKSIHKMYFEAGANVATTNTFGANLLKYDKKTLEEVVCAGIRLCKEARLEAENKDNKKRYIALDLGPLGKLLQPYGDLAFEAAVALFSETVKIAAKEGVDFVIIETMNDLLESKAAMLAVKENSDLPFVLSNVLDEKGRTLTGSTPEVLTAVAEGMGAVAVGMNCSLGPKQLLPFAKKYTEIASVPVLFQPNAGLPVVNDGKTYFDITPEEFGDYCAEAAKLGVRIIGGCCGTTPDYIKAVCKALKDNDIPTENLAEIADKNISVVASYGKTAVFGGKPVIIGERINPTGKKKLKEALRNGDYGYILKEAEGQTEHGADVLDVNCGLPEIDEAETLLKLVKDIQAVNNLPLQIDTGNPRALEKALREYNGKAMINSVNGREDSMNAVFPLAKKYGGLVVCLTLDEKGIPTTVQGRIEIAKKIMKTAEAYGIKKKDLIFDTLCMSVSADKDAGRITLQAVSEIRNGLGANTVLGVSNISFGLPERDLINGTFFGAALAGGLSAGIVNPYSLEITKAYKTYNALFGFDENSRDYIEYAEKYAENNKILTENNGKKPENCAKPMQSGIKSADDSTLKGIIIKGYKEKAGEKCRELLESRKPLEIVSEEIIPALDVVGIDFEKGTAFLPQLLMSAESAKAAFEVIKTAMPAEESEKGEKFVIATVKGDIHDIGKNIVALLLENYGFDVEDLGKDVAPEIIVETIKNNGAKMVGLSALMTTTVPSMEETIRILKKEVPDCLICVGGAVMNQHYADMIGADKYAKDAMDTVKWANEISSLIKEKK